MKNICLIEQNSVVIISNKGPNLQNKTLYDHNCKNHNLLFFLSLRDQLYPLFRFGFDLSWICKKPRILFLEIS